MNNELVVINEEAIGYFPQGINNGYIAILHCKCSSRFYSTEQAGDYVKVLYDSDIIRKAVKEDYETFRIYYKEN